MTSAKTNEQRDASMQDLPFPVWQPGPHYKIADASGTESLMVYPDPVLDSFQEALDYLRELTTEGVPTSGAQVMMIRGGYWLARCTQCGVGADDDGYAYPTWGDVLTVGADVNQTIAELPPYLKRGPEWFVSTERKDLRCSQHAGDYTPAPPSQYGHLPAT